MNTKLIILWATSGTLALCGAEPVRQTAEPATLARTILADPDLPAALDRARALLKSGLNAGSGYGEVWIRDLNTLIELALKMNDAAVIRSGLLRFFLFQGPNGDIVDGYIPKERARAP